MEAFGLAGFVIIAGLLTIILEHPELPVMHSFLGKYMLLRRIPLGLIMGAYITVIVILFSKKSGAHINPSVTLTFLRLGKIKKEQAICYTIAQFAGAVMGAALLNLVAGKWFSAPAVNYGNTSPMPPYGDMTALVAEFTISFIMMLTVLMASSSVRFEKQVALISGVLIAVYLVFELPFSGMSLNPARSFAASFIAGKWKHLWIYFAAPIPAMLLAGDIYKIWQRKRLINKHKDYKEISDYPVKKAT